jgi:hypothetical protein
MQKKRNIEGSDSMRRIRAMKFTPALPGLLSALLLTMLVIPLNAQLAGGSHPYFDAASEVTISGTVSSMLAKPAPGMIWGSHLLIETASGRVDASLGRWALLGKGALSVVPGQQVEVTGVMKTLRDKPVFVVRTVKANGKVYTIRNEHGIPVSPQARERAAQEGESL